MRHCKFAKLEEAFKNCTIKSQDGRGLGCEKVLYEGGFGSLASIQLSDAGNGEAQIALLHVIMKHTWYRRETLRKNANEEVLLARVFSVL